MIFYYKNALEMIFTIKMHWKWFFYYKNALEMIQTPFTLLIHFQPNTLVKHTLSTIAGGSLSLLFFLKNSFGKGWYTIKTKKLSDLIRKQKQNHQKYSFRLLTIS